MPRLAPFAIQHGRVIVCEGSADQVFLRKLIDFRTLPDYDIPFPQMPYGRTRRLGGFAAYGDMLKALKLKRRTIKGILVVADAKDDPHRTFNEVADQIESQGFQRPEAELVPTQTSGLPEIAIMLIPNNGQMGSLETLCLVPLSEQYSGIKRCVDEYVVCTGIDSWNNREKMDKARLQCMIAAVNRDDPNNALRYALEGGLIPLQHGVFTPVAEGLAQFAVCVPT